MLVNVGDWCTVCLALVVWAKKSCAIEMDHVRRRIGNPYFGFPRNGVEIFQEDLAVWKCGHKNKTGRGTTKKCFQFIMPLRIDRAVARNALNEEKPVFPR